MTIEKFVDEVRVLDYEENKNKILEEVIKDMKKRGIDRLYIVKNQMPIFILNNSEIIDIFLSNKLKQTLEEYLKNNSQKIICIDSNMHIIETYNKLRSERLEYAPVVKENKLVGEISFSTLSLKISYIAIKDKLTDTYNEKYFRVIVEEYNEVSSELGIIMLKVGNLSIYEGLYGIDFVEKILKEVSNKIKRYTRSVDFIFRNQDVFKVLTFNNAEITMKIKNRLEEKLKDLEVDNVPISVKVVVTHVPELENNILIAVENLERKLIERD